MQNIAKMTRLHENNKSIQMIKDGPQMYLTIKARMRKNIPPIEWKQLLKEQIL